MTRSHIVVLAVAIMGAASSLAGCAPVDRAEAQGPYVVPRPVTGIDCLGLAERTTGLTPTQMQQLCLGAPTMNGPVDCYLAAVRSLSLTDDQGVLLCRCSPTREPVMCWEHGRSQGRLVDDQIMAMCSPTLAMGLLPNCRIVGY